MKKDNRIDARQELSKSSSSSFVTKISVQLSKRAPAILAAMLLVQLLWFVLIWITGASTNWQKLLGLGIYSILCCIGVTVLPLDFLSEFNLRFPPPRFGRWLLLIITLVVLAIGIVYANNQRIWTFDEENNFAASQMIAEYGVGYFFGHYKDIPWLGNQHPPLVPLINGIAMGILGPSLSSIRYVSLLFTLGTITITYYLGEELYDPEVGLLGALLLTSFPLVLREGTAGLIDPQLTFFFSLAVLLVVRMLRHSSYLLAVAAGLTIGLGLLTKYTMALIFPVLVAFFVSNGKFRNIKLRLAIMVVISCLVLAVWLYYAYEIGVLANQESSVRGYSEFALGNADRLPLKIRWMLNSLLTKLPSAIGPYNIILIFLGGLFAIRRRSPSDYINLLWVSAVSFILVVTLPDHRYFMPIFPPLALMMALWLKHKTAAAGRIVLLSLLFWSGALYLFIDWYRTAELFVQ